MRPAQTACAGGPGKREKAAEPCSRRESHPGDHAFNTQPGHIPERARLIAREDRMYGSLDKAESMRSRADGIEGQLATSIYDDDPDAIEQLRARITRLEAERDEAKAKNAAYRREHKAELAAMGIPAQAGGAVPELSLPEPVGEPDPAAAAAGPAGKGSQGRRGEGHEGYPEDVLLLLEQCECDGERLTLPAQLDRSAYLAVNKVLMAAGGKWNRKAHATEPVASRGVIDPSSGPTSPRRRTGASSRHAARGGRALRDLEGPQAGNEGTGAVRRRGAIEARSRRDDWSPVDCVEIDPRHAQRDR